MSSLLDYWQYEFMSLAAPIIESIARDNAVKKIILFNFPIGMSKYEKLGALLFDLSALTAHTDKQ